MAAIQYKALTQPIMLLSQPATAIWWFQPWDQPQVLYTRPGLTTAQQRAVFGPPVTANAAPTSNLGWLMPISQPVLKPPVLYVDNGLPTSGSSAQAGTALLWFREWSQPVLQALGLGAYQQPLPAQLVALIIGAPTALPWFREWSQPVLTAPDLGAYRQPATAQKIVLIPGAATSIPWFQNWANPVLRAGLQTHLQPTGAIPGQSPVSLEAIPDTLAPGVVGVTVTLIGGGTNWTAGTPGSPTFTLSSTGTGASIVSQVVNSTTNATLTIIPGTVGIITITDPSTGDTTTINVQTAGAGANPAYYGITLDTMRSPSGNPHKFNIGL